jgi:transcriptional regulator with XRE-family HTH domain
MKTKPETIGSRVKAERLRLNWTQMDLAHLIEADPSYVSKVEQDKIMPSAVTGERIALAYGWTLDRLYRGKV